MAVFLVGLIRLLREKLFLVAPANQAGRRTILTGTQISAQDVKFCIEDCWVCLIAFLTRFVATNVLLAKRVFTILALLHTRVAQRETIVPTVTTVHFLFTSLTNVFATIFANQVEKTFDSFTAR